MFKELLRADGPVKIIINIPMIAGEDVVSPPTYPMPMNGNKPLMCDVKDGKGSMYDAVVIDGVTRCTLDSIQSQAHRMQEAFKGPYKHLVPQITIDTGKGVLNMIDLGHRACDAFLMCSDLAKTMQVAIDAYRTGDATQIAKIMPTALVYGFFDSRRSGAKCPRVVASEIVANNVSLNRRSAQFFSMGNMPNDISDALLKELELSDLSSDAIQSLGLQDVPSTNKLGGVYVHGTIERKIGINLEPIKALDDTIQPYILGLALLSAFTPTKAMLRQGCTLVHAGPPTSVLLYNSGITHTFDPKLDDVLAETEAAAKAFGIGESRVCRLCKRAAKDWREGIAGKKPKKGKKGAAKDAAQDAQ